MLCRYHGVEGWPGKTQVAKELWALAEFHSSLERPAAYTQAIMDLGATLCSRRRPACTLCPLVQHCRAGQVGCTGSGFPTPRPKRHRPTKHQSVVVAQRPDGAVLLQRRPDTGVWGGLWSFPELDGAEGADSWSSTQLGTAPAKISKLEPLQHAFTHFDLVLEPILLQLPAEPAAVRDQPGWIWYRHGAESSQSVGLPAPIHTLIDATQRESP